MFTLEERQEDLHSSGCSVTKQSISDEMLRNSLKSQRPKKTSPFLKRQRDVRLKFVRQHKEKENSFWERVLWTMKLKLNCLVIIIKILCGGKMVKPTVQRTWYLLSNLAVAV